MNTTKLVLPASLLSAGEEISLARQIEAGLYAEHLIVTGDRRYPYSALRLVIQAGAQAREQFFQANLRLVMKLAARSAHHPGLSLDDLFQEGCLALGEAIRRFDYAGALGSAPSRMNTSQEP